MGNFEGCCLGVKLQRQTWTLGENTADNGGPSTRFTWQLTDTLAKEPAAAADRRLHAVLKRFFIAYGQLVGAENVRRTVSAETVPWWIRHSPGRLAGETARCRISMSSVRAFSCKKGCSHVSGERLPGVVMRIHHGGTAIAESGSSFYNWR